MQNPQLLERSNELEERLSIRRQSAEETLDQMIKEREEEIYSWYDKFQELEERIAALEWAVEELKHS